MNLSNSYIAFKKRIKPFIKPLVRFSKNYIKYFSRRLNKKLNLSDVGHAPNLRSIYIENSSLCNLNCKFCGYKYRDQNLHPKKIMTIDQFKHAVDQAIKAKFNDVGLTPVTGDVYMDKGIEKKFDYVESQNQIKSFHFYTNLIPCSNKQIESLFSYNKITTIGISIYGLSLDSFKLFTESNEVAFNKLINNLEFLYDQLSSKKSNFLVDIAIRQKKDEILKISNGLTKIIKKLIRLKNINLSFAEDYNNWGGLIPEEVGDELKIDLVKKEKNKYGPCKLIYSKNVIGSDGKVNCCACRDANFTLKIGNVFEKELKDIISLENDVYKNIIKSHQENKFPEVCYTCDFYESIYDVNKGTVVSEEKNSKELKRIS